MADASVAAWVAAGASTVAAFVAWFKAEAVERVRAELAKDLAQTQSDLKRIEDREAQGTRRASELEFKLFTLACESLSETSRALERARGAAISYTALAGKERGNDPRPAGDELLEADSQVRTAGHFLPPDLDRSYLAAAKAIQALASAYRRFHNEDDVETRKKSRDELIVRANKSCRRFAVRARKWKRERWNQFSPAEPELGTDDTEAGA